jgi:hypothetical protein
MLVSVDMDRKKASLWPGLVCAVIALLLAGAAYRVAASHLGLIEKTPITLPAQLNTFPKRICNWIGKDVPISAGIQRIAGNDDFLNRLYINSSGDKWANVYVAYSARPRTMRGHRPQVCYVGSGWIHDSTDATEVISLSGKSIPCLIHRFHKPAPQIAEIVVLNYYILNGRFTNDEKGFSGVGWRTPNIRGDAARYVAQVQVSSVLESSVRSAASDIADLISEYFPDKSGKVKAADYINTEKSL